MGVDSEGLDVSILVPPTDIYNVFLSLVTWIQVSLF